ncbi:MAG: hypothetical protein JRI72_00395 [Deltaproteobacteria bacterium]|nr:hypothetical protein [Deltaproteobacteria bacterium]
MTLSKLSVMQELSIRDDRGNCRCPYCGKYRKRSEFEEQSPHVPLIDAGSKIMGHLHVPAACKYCLEAENP